MSKICLLNYQFTYVFGCSVCNVPFDTYLRRDGAHIEDSTTSWRATISHGDGGVLEHGSDLFAHTEKDAPCVNSIDTLPLFQGSLWDSRLDSIQNLQESQCA